MVQLRRSDSAMIRLAEVAVVAPRNVRCNQLALTPGESAFATEQNVHQCIDRRSSLRAVRHRSDDPRKFAPQLRCDVQLNVGHIEGYS